MIQITPEESLLTVAELAKELGLPVRWLNAEAKAGRLPCLAIGRIRRFRASSVRRHLVERAGTEFAHVDPKTPEPPSLSLPFENDKDATANGSSE